MSQDPRDLPPEVRAELGIDEHGHPLPNTPGARRVEVARQQAARELELAAAGVYGKVDEDTLGVAAALRRRNADRLAELNAAPPPRDLEERTPPHGDPLTTDQEDPNA